MRIALVTHVVGRQDGQGRVNYELAKNILAAGHELTVVSESCATDVAAHERATFVPIERSRLPAQISVDVSFALRAGTWLRKHRSAFDIIQANGFVTWEPVDVVAVHFVHTAWLRNPYYPFQWASLSPYAFYQRSYTLLHGRWERQAFRSARRIIAVSSGTASELVEAGVPADRIAVVPNGVDTEEFRPGPSVRSEFSLPERVPMAVFIGDLRTPRKNLETLLRALVDVPAVHLAVAGGIEGSPSPELAQSLGIASRVHFLGKTARVADLMRSVDFFVFPSRYDTFGLVVLEALASGKPVIVSKNVGAVDYVRGAGIVLDDPEDAVALANAIRHMVAHPDEVRAMGDAGRDTALSLDWKQMAAKYMAVYDDVLAAKQAMF